MSAETAEAYRRCEAITREQAANFYYGIRLLRGDRRRAMCAAYAFARRVDDIGDGTLETQEKLRRLDAEDATLAAVAAQDPAGAGDDPVLLALTDAHERFSLPLDALEELIEGVRMDVMGVAYERFEDLVPYCRRVAGAIGRVCLAIFGLREPHGADRAGAEALADDLGVALQLTNILRDVREDAENGRVYLPAEDLRRFGLDAGSEPSWDRTAPAVLDWIDGDAAADGLERSPSAAPGVDPSHSPPAAPSADASGPEALVRFEAERAREWFERGLKLAPLLDRRSAACVLAMAGIYRRLLERIEAHPRQALERHVSLPASEKAWVAVRAMIAGGG
jgi:phytoene synthase